MIDSVRPFRYFCHFTKWSVNVLTLMTSSFILRTLKTLGFAGLVLGTVGFVLTLTALVVWQGSNERQWQFDTYTELESAGLIQRGIIPEHFPRSATAINVMENHDTTEIQASFRYALDTENRVSEACRRVARTPRGEKFLCPPFDTRSVIMILRADGTARYVDRGYRL